MATLKPILIAGCIITASLTQAICWEGIDYRTYDAYIYKAHTELDRISQELQFEDHGTQNIQWTGQSFADALYPRQKAALKAILEELKIKAHNSQNQNDALLSDLFKFEVYKSWKQTFQNNYNESLKNNDVFGWAWVNQPIPFTIHE